MKIAPCVKLIHICALIYLISLYQNCALAQERDDVFDLMVSGIDRVKEQSSKEDVVIDIIFFSIRNLDESAGNPTVSDEGIKRFNNYMRNQTDGHTYFGTVSVVVPPSTKVIKSLRSPSAVSPYYGGGPLFIRFVRNSQVFIDKLRYLSKEDRSGRCPPFVYIHGYHNSFFDAVSGASQLESELNVGKAIVFTWPGDPPASDPVSQYLKAEKIEENINKYLLAFLVGNVERGLSMRPNLIAHSLGARLFFDSYNVLNSTYHNYVPYTALRTVIMAAADVSREAFTRRFPILSTNIADTELYCSQDDVALLGSWGKHGDLPLGLCPGEISAVPYANVNQLRGQTLDWKRHSFLLASPEVINDIKATFADNCQTLGRTGPNVHPPKIINIP